MPARVTRFQMHSVVGRVRRRDVVLVLREPMVMLGMILVGVRVDVQRRHHSRQSEQCRYEEQCQDTMHEDESMKQPDRRQRGRIATRGKERAAFEASELCSQLRRIPRIYICKCVCPLISPLRSGNCVRTVRRIHAFQEIR